MARWRHLARNGKDLLLCGKDLAIEPCYLVRDRTMLSTDYHVTFSPPPLTIEMIFGDGTGEVAGAYSVQYGVLNECIIPTITKVAIDDPVYKGMVFSTKDYNTRKGTFDFVNGGKVGSGQSVRASCKWQIKYTKTTTYYPEKATVGGETSDKIIAYAKAHCPVDKAETKVEAISHGASVYVEFVRIEELSDSSFEHQQERIVYKCSVDTRESSENIEVALVHVSPLDVGVSETEVSQYFIIGTYPIDDDDNY